MYISLALYSNLILGQIKITYEVIYKPDSTESNYNKEEMSLKYYQGKSYFYNESKFRLDSIYDKITKDYIKTGAIPNVSFKYELNFGTFKDFGKSELYTIQNINSRNYIYQEADYKLNWKLQSEQKMIHNYICKKASLFFGGRLWEAWFTEDIPISDGPYKFHGLPGLILEINDSKKDYHFVTTSISKQNETFKLSSSFIKTTKKDYSTLVNRLIADPALFVRESIMKNSGVVMKGTDGNHLSSNELYDRVKNEFENFVKSHNNPIEKNIVWIR